MNVKYLAQQMRDGKFTILDYIKIAYPEPTSDHELYAFFKTWGYVAWLNKAYDTTLQDELMVAESNYNFVKAQAVIDVDKDGMIIPESIKGLPLVRCGQLLYQYKDKFVAKGTIGIELWKNTTDYSFCMFQAGESVWVGSLKVGTFTYVGEEFEDVKQIIKLSRLSKTKHFAVNQEMVGQVVRFTDNRFDGKVGKVVSVSSHPMQGYTYTNAMIIWQGETEPELVKDINLNFVERFR